MERLRVAVRALVEFTLKAPDINQMGGSLRDMQEGAFGHRARQANMGEDWEAEVPLELTVPVEELDASLLISGRMDAFRDGEVPMIEEIKLWQGKHPPIEAIPAHMAQAVCYGHMLCETHGIDCVDVCVTYVTSKGAVRGQFERRMTDEECRNEFMNLLIPFVRRMKLVHEHRHARNASLHALRFPYDGYRAGQREMAVQVYTAIRLGRRLFASMPTGTGKSVASLFPALKALGEGLTGQVYYLTARTTQRQGALEAVARMHRQTLHLWTLTLDAKDKQCPARTLCHPDYCPRAKGHFLREGEAIDEMLLCDDWSPEKIRELADKYCLCPFEFSLALAELADLTVCDYNYALDPSVHIQRIFDRTSDVTLLIDEAHNLLSRVRDMLSGEVDGGRIRRLRTVVGKAAGRKHALYKAMTRVLNALDSLPVDEEAEEGRLTEIPQSLDMAANDLAEAFIDAETEHFPWDEVGEKLTDTLSPLLGFIHAGRRDESAYAWLWQGRNSRKVTAFALDVGTYFSEATERLNGVVCFSATMEPLEDMKRLLGGNEDDACFAMPSPFSRENLCIVQQDVNTRYAYREASARTIAAAIEAMVSAKPGRYMAFFPSFAFLKQVAERLETPCQVQQTGMSMDERRDFLAPYVPGGEPVLSLCVLGGIFAEGIDLPGDALDGVAIVGVGLPQVNLFQETLREWYQEQLGNGFLYAYQIPGMQKVAQAVGRVIRTETDRGIALLLDDRYKQSGYRRLCPAHWQIRAGEIGEELKKFW